MAAWLPLVKATLPYLAKIAAETIPAFTKSSAEKPDELIRKQIAELQNAVTQNAESVRVLSKQLQDTIAGIEAAATSLQRERQRHNWLLAICLLAALLSLIVSSAVLFSSSV